MLKEAGLAEVGCESSLVQSKFERKALGIEILTLHEEIPVGLNAVGTSHVLERLRDPRGVLECFQRVVRRGSCLPIFVPNGDGQGARRPGAYWGPLVGEKHSLALVTALSVRKAPGFGFQLRFSSSPIERLETTVDGGRPEEERSRLGDEFVVVAQKALASDSKRAICMATRFGISGEDGMRRGSRSRAQRRNELRRFGVSQWMVRGRLSLRTTEPAMVTVTERQSLRLTSTSDGFEWKERLPLP